MGWYGCNMTPVFLGGGCATTFLYSKNTTCIIEIHNTIKYISKTQTETNNMLYRSSFVTFYRKARGLLNTNHHLLINWPLWRGYFGSLRCALEVIPILERWPLFFLGC